MIRQIQQRAARLLLLIASLAIGVGAARAQSITVGPPRPGGNPSTLSNTSFPGSVTISIATFTASPTGGVSGVAVTLAWTGIVNGTACSIDQGVGAVTCANSSTPVAPTTTTTYTLTVSNSAGTSTRTATVFVFGPPSGVQYSSAGVSDPAISATTGNFTVANSAFVGILWRGQNLTGDGANPTCQSGQFGYLTLNVVDATHVTVTVTRQSGSACSLGTINLTVYFAIYDIPTSLANSVQHGTASGNGTNVVITSVSTAKANISFVGNSVAADNSKPQGRVSLVDGTHVNANSDVGNGVYAWQVIDWK